jgi:hypothetical protein
VSHAGLGDRAFLEEGAANAGSGGRRAPDAFMEQQECHCGMGGRTKDKGIRDYITVDLPSLQIPHS